MGQKSVKSSVFSLLSRHYIDNSIVFAGNTTRYVLALQEHIGNCEYYLFDHGGHEICFANDIYARNEEEIVLEIAICTNLAKK